MAQTNQPPISEDHAVSSWRLDVTRNVNEMDSRVTALETVEEADDAFARIITTNDLNIVEPRGALAVVQEDIPGTVLTPNLTAATNTQVTFGSEPSIIPRRGQTIVVGTFRANVVGWDPNNNRATLENATGTTPSAGDTASLATRRGLYYNNGRNYRKVEP